MAEYNKIVINGVVYILVPENEYLPRYAKKEASPSQELIGEEIKKKREDLGLTLKGFGELIGVSEVQLCRLEKGQKPQAATLKKIREKLSNISV